MLVLDTCALIFDALAPERPGARAREAIETRDGLFIADITLWEVAMLAAKNRLRLRVPAAEFLAKALAGRPIKVVAISPAIAEIATTNPGFKDFDPADRLIGATALAGGADLATCDGPLSALPGLSIAW
ncbi:MAG: type II toxin-antitoxin system VapC family toxin [Candidatus Sericytochromatia bacterium]|nr:type II toxin-antitoxin system VapC family toxin [Candidatus Tanganyikabacteria bacterium]